MSILQHIKVDFKNLLHRHSNPMVTDVALDAYKRGMVAGLDWCNGMASQASVRVGRPVDRDAMVTCASLLANAVDSGDEKRIARVLSMSVDQLLECMARDRSTVQ